MILIVSTIVGCNSNPNAKYLFDSPTLRIQQLSENTFIHTSYLDIKGYGLFPCNGLVYINENKAFVFDTPTEEVASNQLIQWIRNHLECSIEGIIVNHFHVDCLGGLSAFHDQGIPSYAHNRTIRQAMEDSLTVPQFGFDKEQQISLGTSHIVNHFFGEGHTPDNIVSYIPAEHMLFGGCLIKSKGASKGNLNDANLQEWSNTVLKIKQKYPDIEIVVPGHGDAGNISLLDYTIELFKVDD